MKSAKPGMIPSRGDHACLQRHTQLAGRWICTYGCGPVLTVCTHLRVLHDVELERMSVENICDDEINFVPGSCFQRWEWSHVACLLAGMHSSLAETKYV